MYDNRNHTPIIIFCIMFYLYHKHSPHNIQIGNIGNNTEYHPGGHYHDHYRGVLPLRQTSVTHLKVRHP